MYVVCILNCGNLGLWLGLRAPLMGLSTVYWHRTRYLIKTCLTGGMVHEPTKVIISWIAWYYWRWCRFLPLLEIRRTRKSSFSVPNSMFQRAVPIAVPNTPIIWQILSRSTNVFLTDLKKDPLYNCRFWPALLHWNWNKNYIYGKEKRWAKCSNLNSDSLTMRSGS